MLKNRDKLDILEGYCGKYSPQFEWLGRGACGWVVNSNIGPATNYFSISVYLNRALNIITIKFRATKTGKMCLLFKCLVADPDGMKKCENKIGKLIAALTTEGVDD